MSMPMWTIHEAKTPRKCPVDIYQSENGELLRVNNMTCKMNVPRKVVLPTQYMYLKIDICLPALRRAEWGTSAIVSYM